MYVKKSGLKRIIKIILTEVRRVGKGEFVEPNGTVHDVEDETHWEWALAYVGNTSRFDTLNPLRELLQRGWIRVVYSYNDEIIMITHHRQLTKPQMTYLEDQAEKTRWAVMDDDGIEIYRSADCITKENPLGEVTQKDLKSTMPGVRSWNIKKVPNQPTQQIPNFKLMTLDNLKALKDKAGRTLKYLQKNKPEEYSQYGPLIWKQWQSYDWEIKRRLKQINQKIPESTEPSIGGSHADQSTNVAWDDITQMERDPLTDPELNGKLNEDGEKTEHFSVEWGSSDIAKGAGKIYLGDKWFANTLKVAEDWSPKYVGKWWINRHEEAFNLNFPATEIFFDDVQSLLDYLEKWYQSRNINEQYKFDEFGWLSTMDGFNKPVDVYYGKIHLGVIESKPDGYVIIVVMGPNKHYRIEAGPQNKFKNKNQAAETLHRTWKTLRTKQV
jgi:hypothetical protein